MIQDNHNTLHNYKMRQKGFISKWSAYINTILYVIHFIAQEAIKTKFEWIEWHQKSIYQKLRV